MQFVADTDAAFNGFDPELRQALRHTQAAIEAEVRGGFEVLMLGAPPDVVEAVRPFFDALATGIPVNVVRGQLAIYRLLNELLPLRRAQLEAARLAQGGIQ